PGEEQRRELARSERASDLPEREERHEGDDQHDDSGEQLVHAELREPVEDGYPGLLVVQPFDDMLENAEQEYEHAEQCRFEERGYSQRSNVEPPSKPKSLADQDDLGDDQRLDHGEPVVQISHPELREDQPAVDGERAEEQGEI